MTNPLRAIITILSAAVGAIISRWHGGGFRFSASKTIKNMTWALPFGLCSLFVVLPYTNSFVSCLIGATAFSLCLAGKATGHGRVWNAWVPLEWWVEPEKIESITLWTARFLNDFWYKNLAMFLIGFAAVSGAAFAFGYVNVWAGIGIALGGGLGKVAGYLIGWKRDWLFGNEFGELFTGLCSYSALAASFLYIMKDLM